MHNDFKYHEDTIKPGRFHQYLLFCMVDFLFYFFFVRAYYLTAPLNDKCDNEEHPPVNAWLIAPQILGFTGFITIRSQTNCIRPTWWVWPLNKWKYEASKYEKVRIYKQPKTVFCKKNWPKSIAHIDNENNHICKVNLHKASHYKQEKQWVFDITQKQIKNFVCNHIFLSHFL